jgi:hypothetical protein
MTQTFSSDVKKWAVKLNYTLVIMIYLGALFFFLSLGLNLQ